jgi:hypothetical protein
MAIWGSRLRVPRFLDHGRSFGRPLAGAGHQCGCEQAEGNPAQHFLPRDGRRAIDPDSRQTVPLRLNIL